jgi:hypothetical protein
MRTAISAVQPALRNSCPWRLSLSSTSRPAESSRALRDGFPKPLLPSTSQRGVKNCDRAKFFSSVAGKPRIYSLWHELPPHCALGDHPTRPSPQRGAQLALDSPPKTRWEASCLRLLNYPNSPCRKLSHLAANVHGAQRHARALFAPRPKISSPSKSTQTRLHRDTRPNIVRRRAAGFQIFCSAFHATLGEQCARPKRVSNSTRAQ